MVKGVKRQERNGISLTFAYSLFSIVNTALSVGDLMGGRIMCLLFRLSHVHNVQTNSPDFLNIKECNIDIRHRRLGFFYVLFRFVSFFFLNFRYCTHKSSKNFSNLRLRLGLVLSGFSSDWVITNFLNRPTILK